MQALAQNVTVIPARRRVGSQRTAAQVQKIRVAAYCRVPTDSEEQETSYEAQVSHYMEYIKSKPEWQMVEVYADDGISGTNTARRDEFNRMIADCEAGKIDLILTKSISRFSRNTLDCLKYTRKLKALNIAVFFEKENINTMDSKGEVLLTIMASLAQQESESLSANVRMGIQYRNQQGKVQINHNWFLGYTKDAEGNLVIDSEQAEIVRRIHREYLEGASFLQIKRSLEADGIPDFECYGEATINSAIKMGLSELETPKNQYKTYGTQYLRPWIFMLTSGDADYDDSDKVGKVNLLQAQKSGTCRFLPICVNSDFNKDVISSLNIDGIYLTTEGFQQAFEWIGNSLNRISGLPYQQNVVLPNPNDYELELHY